MSTHAQDTLLAHLTTPDSLDYLLDEGFSRDLMLDVIPSDVAKKVTAWCLNYFFDNQRVVAPSKAAILEAWGRDLEKVDLVIDDEYEPDSIQGAVAQLRATYAESESQRLVREIATEMAGADTPDKIAVIGAASWRFHELNQRLVSRRHHQDAISAYDDAIERYLDRRDNGNVTRGLVFGIGMEQFDQHFHGVHPGEIMVVAGATGVGKSWFAARACLGMWKAGKKAVYFTLEVDTPMTADRLICMHAGVSYASWQTGDLEPEEIERVLLVRDNVEKSEKPFEIIMPNEGERSVLEMYRRAIMLGAEVIIIDQLTFIEHDSSHREEHLRIKDTMHQLQSLCNEGAYQLPVLLMHQVNREGVEYARKNGRYEKDHVKGGAEIENTSSILIFIYQSDDQRIVGEAELQNAKHRRGKRQDFLMSWRLEYGDIRVKAMGVSV